MVSRTPSSPVNANGGPIAAVAGVTLTSLWSSREMVTPEVSRCRPSKLGAVRRDPGADCDGGATGQQASAPRR